jgi:KDO2-lipid IV(A) lauroyltransferase
VRKNLKNAFPEKTDKERREIERKYYRHLCDYFVETMKTLRISEVEIRKRMKFENPEMVNRLVKESGSCLVALGHYANWEWVPSIGLHMTEGVKTGLIYKQLKSDAFDRLFLKVRSRFDSLPIEKRRTYRTIIKARDEKLSVVVGFLLDQRPPRRVTEYWTRFLNQDTLIETGLERIARSMALPVVYLDIQKVKRGRYVGRFFVITPDASIEPKYAVTERYARKLESTILNEPAYYLWTHDRWKYPRE